MSYPHEQILAQAQRARHAALKRLFGMLVSALARGARKTRVFPAGTAQTSRRPSFAAAYTASVRLRASSARSTEER
jgi:hypothetical protein